jgi:hypothetical protein
MVNFIFCKGIEDGLVLDCSQDVICLDVCKTWSVFFNTLYVQYKKRKRVSRTGMNKLTLSMQVVQSQEQLFQRAFKNCLCETAVWDPIHNAFKAIPHWLLNKAGMITACMWYREYIQRCPNMGITRMVFVACA